MTRVTESVATALLGAVPAIAAAQSGWENGYRHMWGGGSGPLGALMMIPF